MAEQHKGKVGWIWDGWIRIEQGRPEQILKRDWICGILKRGWICGILKRDWICGIEQMETEALWEKYEPKLVNSGANRNQKQKPNHR